MRTHWLDYPATFIFTGGFLLAGSDSDTIFPWNVLLGLALAGAAFLLGAWARRKERRGR